MDAGSGSGEGGGGTAAAPRLVFTSGRWEMWPRSEFRIRGKEFGFSLPAECSQVESEDHRLAVFEGREFDPELVDLIRVEVADQLAMAVSQRGNIPLRMAPGPELFLVPILENRRLVVGRTDWIPLQADRDHTASYFTGQIDAALARFGLGHRWMCSSPGKLYVSRERRTQFYPDLDVSEIAVDIDRSDLPRLLALEVMAQSDDPGDIDRKCRGMVEAGAAHTAIGLFVWDPARPEEVDGTVKVYRRSEDRNVELEVHHLPRFVPLDDFHKGMRLYMPSREYYGVLSRGVTPSVAWDMTEHQTFWLDACCDVRYPERVKEAINFVESLNSQDNDGRLCMVEAAKAGDVSLLDYMHQHGASLGEEDAEGVSPYLAARAQKRAEACEWLEERGCVLHNPQKELDEAIRSQKTRVVEYLLLAGESEKFAAGE